MTSGKNLRRDSLTKKFEIDWTRSEEAEWTGPTNYKRSEEVICRVLGTGRGLLPMLLFILSD